MARIALNFVGTEHAGNISDNGAPDDRSRQSA
jgi:hypothetical protein